MSYPRLLVFALLSLPLTLPALANEQSKDQTLEQDSAVASKENASAPDSGDVQNESAPTQADADAPRHVKAMVITTFGPERNAWAKRLSPSEDIDVPGLHGSYPSVSCNENDVCLMTTGKGYANAATSISTLAFSPKFDLSDSWFLVSGVSSIDPRHATLGSPTWPRYLIDFGIQWELDARDIPEKWTTGYLSINTHTPGQDPHQEYGTEFYHLDDALVDRAVALSKDVELTDSDSAAAYRQHYNDAPANAAPSVVQCDSVSSDTWWYGNRLADRAEQLASQLTEDKASICTAQQEDNAILTAFKRAEEAGRLHRDRVAVVRAGASFSRPYEGLAEAEGLTGYAKQGGYQPALTNMVRAGYPLIEAIVSDWPAWQKGVPDMSEADSAESDGTDNNGSGGDDAGSDDNARQGDAGEANTADAADSAQDADQS